MTEHTHPHDPLVTVPEFAQQLGVTYATAKAMLDKPDAPAPTVAIGNRKAYSLSSLRDFIAARYSNVIDFLDYAPREGLESAIKAEADRSYEQGHSDGYREASKEWQTS